MFKPLLALILLGLAGCRAFCPAPGRTVQQMNADLYECTKEAAGPTGRSDKALRMACMLNRGHELHRFGCPS